VEETKKISIGNNATVAKMSVKEIIVTMVADSSDSLLLWKYFVNPILNMDNV
jgi:hypothetical protein